MVPELQRSSSWNAAGLSAFAAVTSAAADATSSGELQQGVIGSPCADVIGCQFGVDGSQVCPVGVEGALFQEGLSGSAAARVTAEDPAHDGAATAIMVAPGEVPVAETEAPKDTKRVGEESRGCAGGG